MSKKNTLRLLGATLAAASALLLAGCASGGMGNPTAMPADAAVVAPATGV
ncbi:hypothetical protein [Mycobacterium szulgai]|nr:hypothetical protein [Mycobacterium szulgai]MCV7079499.1 hypothetical protein [Mycobacterium szulgai]